jgi:hypothetical protein
MTDTTSDIFKAHKAQQQKLADYRLKAEKLFGTAFVKVNPHGTVQPCEGGAFVEMIVWVPDEE